MYFIFAIGLIYIAIFNRRNIFYAIIAVTLAIAIDTILFKVTHGYVTRDRPFIHLLNSLSDSAKAIWINWPTYPSGHVRDMALYSIVLSGYAPKLIWLFVAITMWVSYTRIYLGAHYLTDVLAGLVLGYLTGLGILMIVKSLQQITRNQKEPSSKSLSNT